MDGRHPYSPKNDGPRRPLLVRLTLFLALELVFIALAISCLATSIPPPFSFSKAQSQLFFTVVFIVWHTVAIMNARDCVLHDFSSEWYNRFKATNRLVPGDTDIVSTITSGFSNQVRYFFTVGATKPYRSSFLALWGLVALQSIGPGVIHVDDVLTFTPTSINITNYSATDGNTTTSLLNILPHGTIAANLELQQKSSFGFGTQVGAIVGWPDMNSAYEGDLEYETDVLEYDMKCRWEAPSFNLTLWNTTWYAGDFAWYPCNPFLTINVSIGGIIPMYRFSPNQKFEPHQLPDILPATDSQIGLSGYLFIGSNSSFNSRPNQRRLNLDHLPTLHSASGFHMIDVDGNDGFFELPLATFLLCDPTARILDGRVSLSQANNSLTVLSTSHPSTNTTRIGNITPGAANFILGIGILGILDDSGELTEDMALGISAAQAFLNDTSLNFTTTTSTPFDVGVLPLEDIQPTLNVYMRSSAKGFSSYFRDRDTNIPSSFYLQPVHGSVKISKLELIASRPLLGTTVALFGGVALALITNHFLLRSWRIPSFKLKSLIQNCRISDKSYTADRKIPSVGIRRFQHLTYRLAAFMILEAAYLILIFACSSREVTIDLPLSSTDVNGGFTVLLITWQSLAIYLASEVITFAFSTEWSRREEHIDRVSRLTSGFGDKARYFLTPKPTLIFRIALIASLLLTALNSLAPGAISISELAQPANISLDVADFRSVTSSENLNDFVVHESRSRLIVYLEHHENLTYEYSVEPLAVIGWPSYQPGADETGDIEYSTDIIRFNFSCSWRVPHTVPDEEDTAWIVDGQEWVVWDVPPRDIRYVGGIIPLGRPMEFEPDAKSAYLFVGTNISLPVISDVDRRPFINLDGLPTSPHPSGFSINSSSLTSHWSSPLSTILLCDPHIELSGGRASLTSSTKSLKVAESGLPPVGNIPMDAANTIFAESMLRTLSPDVFQLGQWIGQTSTEIFLTNTTMNWEAFPNGVPVLDLDTIGRKLNDLVPSVSKAFTDGLFVDGSDQSNVTHQVMSVAGTTQVRKLRLAGNRVLGFVILGICAAVVLCYGTLMGLMRVHPGDLFDLEHILEVVWECYN